MPRVPQTTSYLDIDDFSAVSQQFVTSPGSQQPEESETTSQPATSFSLPSVSSIKFLKRLPKASREPSGKKLAIILDAIVRKNDLSSWERLLRFGTPRLRRPGRGGRNWSLATAVNKQLQEEADPPPSARSHNRGSHISQEDSLAARVSVKLEEGDFKGAVRLACSDDTLAPMNEATYEALLERHPPLHPDSIIPTVEEASQDHSYTPIRVTEEEIVQAILSFPKDSASGPDGFRPQHLKDMMSEDVAVTSSSLPLPPLSSW